MQTLTRLNVSATVEVLGWFGIPALQHGNVIEVATGDVVFIPAGTPHSYEVLGDERFEFLCVVPNLPDRMEIARG